MSEHDREHRSEPARRPLVTRRGALIGLAVLVPVAALGCGGSSGPDCAQPAGLTPAEQQQRTTMHYRDRSGDQVRNCRGCSFYTAAASADACGGCTLGLGAVSPEGVCDGFAARS